MNRDISILVTLEANKMSVAIDKEEAKKWIGHNIDAVKKDGSVFTGKLVGIKGSKLRL
jgi:ribosomal protein L35AE/L33A